MWSYDKKLQYPVKIKTPSPQNAKIVMTQLGGPDGETGAAMRYLHQRYSCPYGKITGVLTDIGTEELGHMEMISAIVYQLTRDLCMEEVKKQGFADYFVDHTAGIYPVAASGVPFSVSPIASKGDLITDLHEDLAADDARLQEQHRDLKGTSRFALNHTRHKPRQPFCAFIAQMVVILKIKNVKIRTIE